MYKRQILKHTYIDVYFWKVIRNGTKDCERRRIDNSPSWKRCYHIYNCCRMYLEQECERRWKARETTRLSSIRDSIALSRKRMKWSTHAIVHKIYGISSACDDPRTLPRTSSNIRSCRARARISIYQYIIGVHPSIYMSIYRNPASKYRHARLALLSSRTRYWLR